MPTSERRRQHGRDDGRAGSGSGLAGRPPGGCAARGEREQITPGLAGRTLGRALVQTFDLASQRTPRKSSGRGRSMIGRSARSAGRRRRSEPRRPRLTTTMVAVRFAVIAFGQIVRRGWPFVLLFTVHPASAAVPVDHASTLQAVVVIPARFASSRLPGKPLADIDGRPMIEHVYRRAESCAQVSRVIVATDDRRIADAVSSFGGEVRLTRADHRSGTDRLAEVAATLDCDLIVNVQGDEPLIDPGALSGDHHLR